MIACQSASRDFIVLLDLWQALPPPPPRLDTGAAYFLVTHCGSKWGEGENQVFIHQETQMRVREFMDKLTALYSSMEVVALEDSKAQPVLKPGVAYVVVASLRRDAGGVFQHDREGAGEQVRGGFLSETKEEQTNSFQKKIQGRRRCSYNPPAARTKRLRAGVGTSALLSPVEASLEDVRTRAAALRAECAKPGPDATTALVLQTAISTSNTGLIKVCLGFK
jgi:hypothetical protein